MKNLSLLLAIPILLVLLNTVFDPSIVSAQKDDTPPDGAEEILQDQNVYDNSPDIPEQMDSIDTTTDENGKILDPFFVDISVGPQSPWNGKVPLTVTIRSKIDASRTEVTWEYGYGVSIDDTEYKNFFPLPKDTETTVTGYLKPAQSGPYTITVNVTDWGYGRNYSSTDTVRIDIDENLLVTPSHPNRVMLVIIRVIVLILLAIVFLVIIYFLGKKFLTWLKIWLKPPQI